MSFFFCNLFAKEDEGRRAEMTNLYQRCLQQLNEGEPAVRSFREKMPHWITSGAA